MFRCFKNWIGICINPPSVNLCGSKMWRTILSLACIITINTGIFSQSIVNKNENPLNYTNANNSLHGNTNTKGSVHFKRDHKPYRNGINAVKYKPSMLERHKKIHIDDTYRTPQGELSRHIHQHEETDAIVNLNNVSSRLARRQATSQICQRLPLYVNFRSIGWKWIYAPTGFSAFVCQGECDEPLSDPKSPLYATVQALANSTKESKNKPLCCVPTKLSSLDVEYFVGRNKLTLKMPDIIVEECGCR